MKGLKTVNEFWKGIFGSLEKQEKRISTIGDASNGYVVNISADRLPAPQQSKLDAMLNPCAHKWARGMLPGQKYVGICGICGTYKNVDKTEWDTLV